MIEVMGPSGVNGVGSSNAAAWTRAAAGPAAAAATAVLPVLPQTIRYPVAGLVFLIPFLRLALGPLNLLRPRAKTTSETTTPENSATGPLAGVNLAGGFVEQATEKGRSLGALAGTFGALTLYNQPSLMTAAAVLLFAVAARQSRHRVESNLLDSQSFPNSLLTPEGWERQEARALGPLGPLTTSDFPRGDLVQGNPPPYAEGVKKEWSLWANIAGMAMTVGIVFGIFRRTQIRIKGWKKAALEMVTTVVTRKRVPVCATTQEKMDVILPRWVMRLARIYGMTLRFEGFEKLRSLPPNARVITFGARHASIWTDFTSLFADPRCRPAADGKNFRFHPVMRFLGLGYTFDVMGLPALPPRGESNHDQLNSFFKRTLSDMAHARLYPLVFGTGGRLPRRWERNGQQAASGLRSNVVDPNDPRKYLKVGGTVKLVQGAMGEKDAGPLYICVEDIRGTEFVMPKVENVGSHLPFIGWLLRKLPFFQRIRRGGTVTLRVAEMISVTPQMVSGSGRDVPLGGILEEAARRATDANRDTEEFFRKWAEQAGRPRLAAVFKDRARKDEGYYIATDRIGAVHPSLPARGALESRFLSLLERENSTEELDSIIRAASAAVKRHEYGSFE